MGGRDAVGDAVERHWHYEVCATCELGLLFHHFCVLPTKATENIGGGDQV